MLTDPSPSNSGVAWTQSRRVGVRPGSSELRFALAPHVANSDESRGNGSVALEVAAAVFVCPKAECASQDPHIARRKPA